MSTRDRERDTRRSHDRDRDRAPPGSYDSSVVLVSRPGSPDRRPPERDKDLRPPSPLHRPGRRQYEWAEPGSGRLYEVTERLVTGPGARTAGTELEKYDKFGGRPPTFKRLIVCADGE